MCEGTKSIDVGDNESTHEVLEAFRIVANHHRILTESKERTYQLLKLEYGGYYYTFQCFVFCSNSKLFRIGTKEPNVCLIMGQKRSSYYIPYPVTE